jgi:micrococcal nuclease
MLDIMPSFARFKQPKYLLSLLVVFLIAGWTAVEKEVFGGPILSSVPQGEKFALTDPRLSGPSTSTDPMDAFSKPRVTNFKVTSVIDGDTIKVADGEDIITVRLIGINAPETGTGTRPAECFGKEATEHLRAILPEGTMVALDMDSSQGQYDKYQRLLAYVMLSDHTNIALKMIIDGYAYEYTYDKPYLYVAAFKDHQVTAQKEGRGLWADGACGMKNI